MEIRVQQVMLGMVEAVAVHQLLRYVRHNTNEERMRLATGAALAGLGYVFGPEIQERIARAGHEGLSQATKEQLLFAAGGALAGGVGGYIIGPVLGKHRLLPAPLEQPRISTSAEDAAVQNAANAAAGIFARQEYAKYESLDTRVQQSISNMHDERKADPTKPGGLLVLACGAFLGYSLFLDGKTPEEQQRHLWGLGAGAVGYAFAPEAIRALSRLTVPKSSGETAIEMYAKGAAVTGAVIGGITGYYNGARWFGSQSVGGSSAPQT